MWVMYLRVEHYKLMQGICNMKSTLYSKVLQKISIFFLLSLFNTTAIAVDQCSDLIGEVTINEVYDAAGGSDVNFIEIKVLGENLSRINISEYKLSLSNINVGNQDPIVFDLSDAVTCADCPWHYMPEQNGDMAKIVFDENGFDILLLDGNNDIVDYLTVNGYSQQASLADCNFPYPTQAFVDGQGGKVKSVHRIADGTGDWVQVESNSGQTPGDGNDDPSFPYLTINDVTVNQGTTATLNVTLEDIPANYDQIVSFNFSTDDGTALAEQHYQPLIDAFDMDPDGGQTTLDIEIPTILIPDQITRQFSGVIFGATAANIRKSTSIITIEPAETFHHFEILHDGEGDSCSAESVLIKACKNEDCSELFEDEIDLDFQVNGITKSSLTLIEGEAETQFSYGYVGDAVLSVANPTIPAENPLQCNGEQTDCVMSFTDFDCLSCDTGWQDGATSFGTDNDGIEFESNTQIINNPDNILATANLEVDEDSELLSCEDEHCTASGSPVVKPVLGPFLSAINAEQTPVYVGKGEEDIVGDNSINNYQHIEVDEGGTLSFATAYSEYRITTLKVYENVTLNLAPGDYWIENLLTKKGNDNLPQDADNLTVNVVGDGLVRLFLTGHIDFFDFNRVNVEGDPANFWLISYDKLHIKKSAQINAVIYSETDFHIQENSVLIGAISSDKVKVEQDSKIVYGCDYIPPVEIPDELCDVTFIDGVTTHLPTGKVTFEEFSQIVDNPDVRLATSEVINPDFTLFTNTCDTAPCEASGIPSAEFDVGPFKATSSTERLTINGSGVIGDLGINEYQQVTINTGAEGTFTNNYNHYRITTLDVCVGAQLTFTAGDYWLDNLVLNENVELITQGSVRLFVNDELVFSTGLTVNNLGIPEDLFIYGYSNIILVDAPALEPFKNVEMSAMVYSKADVTFGNLAEVKGAVAAQNVYLSYVSKVIYQCELGGEPPIDPPDLYCAAPFVDGATSFSSVNESDKPNIKFGNNAKILHNPDTVLESFTVDSFSDGISCLDPAFDPDLSADCTESGVPVSPLELDEFLQSGSATDITVGKNQHVVIGPEDSEFDFIKVKEGGTAEFAANDLEYRIKKLELEAGATLLLAPGDYWVEELKTKDSEHYYEIYGEGIVRFFVDGHVDIRNNSRFNSTGEPSDFLIFAYDKFHVKQNVEMTALIYAVNDFHIESGSVLYGAVSSAKIDLKDNSTIEFACISAEPPEPLLQIIHDGNGLTCQAEPIVIRACLDAACSATDTSVNTDVVLAINGQTESTISIVNGVSNNASFIHVQPTTASLSLPNNDFICRDSSTDTDSCDVLFADAGFIIDITDNLSCGTQNLTITAVKTDDATQQCIGALLGPKNINFSFEYTLPNVGSMVPSINAITMNPAGEDKAYELVFDINSQATISDFKYNDAGRINVKANYTETEGDFEDLYLEGLTNVLLYPAQLVANATKNIDGSPILDGSNIEKAGLPFTTSISAQCMNGDITPNYRPNSNQSIQINASRTAPIHNVLGGDGTLSTFNTSLSVPVNSSWITAFIEPALFNNGVIFDQNSTYSEVGFFNLSIRDIDYGGHQINGSNNDIGRFTPHHFIQTVAEHGDFYSSCEAFVYTGQTVGISESVGAMHYGVTPQLKITPYNFDGMITKNYIQSFMKLTPSSVDRATPINDNKQIGNQGTLLTLDANLSLGQILPAEVSEESGSVNYIFNQLDNFIYHRNESSLIIPFTSEIQFVINHVVDSDGISSQYTDNLGDQVNAVEPPVTGGLEVRFGRWRIHDTFGPETELLQQLIQTEYFDGEQFTVNNVDNCTIYETDSFALVDLDSLSPNEVSISNSIPGNLFIDGEINSLRLRSNNDNPGQIGLTYDVPKWLKYDWLETEVFDQNPQGTATFGVFDNTGDRVISEKEIDK